MFKVKGTSSDGDEFFVDGSEFGKSFNTVEDAIGYAMGYARAVGHVNVIGEVSSPGWELRATKPDGYFEDIRIIAV